MSNGGPAMPRDARQDAGVRTTRQPTTVGLTGARAYLDPRRPRMESYILSSRRNRIAMARASAIEDAREDCRSTNLRRSAR